MEKYIEYKDNLCFKCLKECDGIKTYHLRGRGYGSSYDCVTTKLQLCGGCREGVDEDLDKWFNEQDNSSGNSNYWEEYKHEENIIEYIDSLPVQGRELFENQLMVNAFCNPIPSQDWIDIELGVACDSIYKKNGLYSPSEVNAYRERFPKCKHTYIKTYEDGSVNSLCSMYTGVYGDKEGNANEYNISSKCYYCDSFELREKPKEVVDTKAIALKEVVMLEGFCPNCGVRFLSYKDDIVYGHKGIHFCSKCYQELAIDLSKYEEDIS